MLFRLEFVDKFTGCRMPCKLGEVYQFIVINLLLITIHVILKLILQKYQSFHSPILNRIPWRNPSMFWSVYRERPCPRASTSSGSAETVSLDMRRDALLWSADWRVNVCCYYVEWLKLITWNEPTSSYQCSNSQLISVHCTPSEPEVLSVGVSSNHFVREEYLCFEIHARS